MQVSTGDIVPSEKLTDEQKKSGDYVPIPLVDEARVKRMNKEKRKAWAKKQRPFGWR